MRPLLLAALGAIIAGIYVIAYDTALGSSALEGGQRITQHSVATIMAAGAIAGFIVGLVVAAGSAGSKTVVREIRRSPPDDAP